MKRTCPLASSLLLASFAFAFATPAAGAQNREFDDSLPLYTEPYRPQYHYTPAHRWIGDPCGLIKHNGRYLAYSWGAAESDELIHWRELNTMAIKDVPENISCFTGSVVIDSLNTAGYGAGAPVALFTSFDKESKKQSQSMAFSLDGGQTYQYYDLNPVLDIWSTEFRDPTVVWDADRHRWVMLVAKALEKKVAFYASDDLKHWTWLSDFGPMGDNERSWECPDIVRIPVEGEEGVEKWVLIVSVNWQREQYFVGEWDGERFIPDHPYALPNYVDDGLDYYASRVFQNFDGDQSPVYTLGWVNYWDYAPQAPSTWGKGVWSLPREYRLKPTADGYRLRQLPVESVEALRGGPFRLRRTLPVGVTQLPKVAAMGNTYEMIATFTPQSKKGGPTGGHPFGINLCEGDGRKVTLQYDPSSGTLTVDRTNSADTHITHIFPRIAHTHVPLVDGRLTLRIFVDRSTVEVFVNDGEKVMTLLTYAAIDQTGASLFTLSPVTADITVYPLRSIH